MIAFVLDALTELVLTPQRAVTSEDHRAYLDPEAEPLELATAVLDVTAETSRPIASDIGGGGQIEHVVTVIVGVVDGDPVRGEHRRDAILLDLVLRLESEKSLQGWESPDGRQYIETTTWRVDYGAVDLTRTGANADPAELAAHGVLVVTARATLNP